MRWLVSLLLLLLPLRAHAQSPAVRTVLLNSLPYQGPADALGLTPKGFWGLMAMSNAVAQARTKAINIRRASDNATRDIPLLPTGVIDQAMAAAFGAATTLTVTEFYDQTGNGFNGTQATAADQCVLVLYSANGGKLPRCTTNGTVQGNYSLVSPGAISQPLTMTLVGTNTTNVQGQFLGTITNGKPLIEINTNGTFSQGQIQYTAAIQGGNFASPALTSVVSGVINGASSVVNDDGTDGTVGTTGTAGASDTDWILLNTNSPLQGDMKEVALWTVGFTAAQRSTYCHNAYLRWGTQTPC